MMMTTARAESVLSAGPAGHGTVTVDGSGHATYVPAPGYAGTDTFTYVVSDGQGGTTTAHVTITVSNADPVAVDDSASVAYDTPLTVDVLANDTDPNIPGTAQTLTVSSVHLVSGHATPTITSDGQLKIDPHAGFAGDVVVEYGVSDGAGGTATGLLTVHVAVPVAAAVDDSTTTAYQTPVTIDVLANDGSGQAGANPALVAGTVTNPVDADGGVQGSVTVIDGQLRYSPPTTFAGTVTLDYTISNPLRGTDTAAATIVVRAQPVEELTDSLTLTAEKDSVTLDPGAKVTGHGALTLVSVTQPPSGAVVTIVHGHVVVTRGRASSRP
jgi:hypothetical protein